MGNANRAVDLLLGGFQINSVTTWQSGLPFTPTYANCGQDQDVGVCRVIISGDIKTDGDRNGFFTTIPTALANPGDSAGPYTRPLAGEFGSKRNGLIGPGYFNTDLSVAKNFPISERFRAQFRAEALNVFNHVNLGQPNGCVDCGPTSGSGTITSIASNSLMRNFQFGLRVEF